MYIPTSNTNVLMVTFLLKGIQGLLSIGFSNFEKRKSKIQTKSHLSLLNLLTSYTAKEILYPCHYKHFNWNIKLEILITNYLSYPKGEQIVRHRRPYLRVITNLTNPNQNSTTNKSFIAAKPANQPTPLKKIGRSCVNFLEFLQLRRE